MGRISTGLPTRNSLTAFIDFTLQQTRNSYYSSDRALELLDCAWESQKRL
jgi:hypothetical protein